MVGARGSAYYVSRFTLLPALAPLRSLPQPSLAAYLTSSQRSLRFESSLRRIKYKKGWLIANPFNIYLVGARGFEPPTSWSQTNQVRFAPQRAHVPERTSPGELGIGNVAVQFLTRQTSVSMITVVHSIVCEPFLPSAVALY